MWKMFEEMGIPVHLTCFLRNLYAGQEATVTTGHGTTGLVPNWEKSTPRLYIVTLFVNFYAEYIMRNAGLNEVQAGFQRGRGTRGQIANIHWIMEKARELQKKSTSTMLKPLTVWITTNCGKFFKRWEYQTT